MGGNKELLPPLEEDFINNRIEATFGEFFGTQLFITQQNLVNLNGGNVNKCQLLPSVSGLVVSTLTFILGKSLFGLSHLSSVDTASNQIGKVSRGKILKLPLKLQFFQKKIASNPQ